MTHAPASQALLFDLTSIEDQADASATIVPADLLDVRLPPDVVCRMTRDEKVALVLEHWPDARKEDRWLMLGYWAVFDRLHERLGVEAFERFCRVFVSITTPETIRRGRQSVQKLRTDAGHLLPDAQTIQYRRSRDGAGAPRR